MELKLKNEQPEEKVTKKLEDLTDDYIAGNEPIKATDEASTGAYINNPVKISTTVKAPVPNTSKSGVDIMGIIKWVVIVVVLVVGVKLVLGLINPKSTDITDYVNMEKEQLEKELDVTLAENSSMSTQITHYSNGAITVAGDGKLGVVYIDGKQKGVHINDKAYSMYGVSIGDPEYKLEELVNFNYEESFNVLDDMLGGKSTATFFYNSVNNDCLVVVVNDKSARVVALTYFNDYKLVTQNLSGLD